MNNTEGFCCSANDTLPFDLERRQSHRFDLLEIARFFLRPCSKVEQRFRQFALQYRRTRLGYLPNTDYAVQYTNSIWHTSLTLVAASDCVTHKNRHDCIEARGTHMTTSNLSAPLSPRPPAPEESELNYRKIMKKMSKTRKHAARYARKMIQTSKDEKQINHAPMEKRQPNSSREPVSSLNPQLLRQKL